jgi:hypothetical protein
VVAKACLASRQRVARLRLPLLACSSSMSGRSRRGQGDDGYVFEVLGGGTDHGWAADVDVFDEMAEGYAGLGRGLFEGVEIDDDHVDGQDAVFGDGGFVLGFAADVEQPPWTRGCRVLTRPSSISGKPVRSLMSRTARPASRRARRCRRSRGARRRSWPVSGRRGRGRFCR